MRVERTATDSQNQNYLHQYCQWAEQMPVATVVYTAAVGDAVYCNQRATDVLGVEHEISGVVDPLRLSETHPLKAVVQRVLYSGQPLYDYSLVLTRGDGQPISVVANLAILADPETGARAVICTLQPLSQGGDLQTGRGLSATVQLPEVEDGSPVYLTVLHGSEFIVERINQRFRKMTGSTEVVGKAASEVWPQLRDQQYLDPLEQVFKSGQPYTATDLPVWLRQQPGAPLVQMHCDFHYEPSFSAAGQVDRVVMKIVDVSSQHKSRADWAQANQQSERNLRLYETILDNTPDLVYVFNLDHRFSYANAALLKMWGRHWDDAIGKNCLELGYESWHAAMHDREIDRVVRTKKSVRGEVPYTGRSGTRIYEYIFVPVLGKSGEVEAVAGTTRDTTGHKQLERELQRRADDLAESDRKKDEFIAMLAHELRNPLAPIRNGLEVMALSAGDPLVVEQARKMMQRQLTHLVRLVDDLMDVSRITRNKLKLRRTKIAIDSVINSAIEATQPALEAAGHILSVTSPGQTYYLQADLTRLAQVFSNLLSNSIKYTAPGGHIGLHTSVVGNRLQIEICDDGIGIPPQKLSSVFDLFSQGGNDAKDGDGGLGIGLALVRALVRMHGGTVDVTSNWPDSGTRFVVSLPYLVEAQMPVAPAMPMGDAPTVPSARRILVVDDNRDACESMSQLFDLLGHTVKTAFNGLDALALAEEFQPEIMFMDIGMPLLNGFETVRRIRTQPWGQSIRVVAVTGWGQDRDRAQSRSAGFDGHLVKPVSLQAVQEQLDALGGDH